MVDFYKVPDPDEQKLMILVRDAADGRFNPWRMPEVWEGRSQRYWHKLLWGLKRCQYLEYHNPVMIMTRRGRSAMVNSSIWRVSLEDHPTHVGSQT